MSRNFVSVIRRPKGSNCSFHIYLGTEAAPHCEAKGKKRLYSLITPSPEYTAYVCLVVLTVKSAAAKLRTKSPLVTASCEHFGEL